MPCLSLLLTGKFFSSRLELGIIGDAFRKYAKIFAAMSEHIFTSSVQKKLATDRRALKNYFSGYLFLGRFEIFSKACPPPFSRRMKVILPRWTAVTHPWRTPNSSVHNRPVKRLKET